VRLFLLALALALQTGGGPTAVVRDLCANEWRLETEGEGKRRLMVRPAQAPGSWVMAEVPGLTADRWSSVGTAEDGFIWLLKDGRSYRFDPRHPEKGLAEGLRRPERITAQSAWKVAARMAETNHDLTGAVVGGKLYIAGGLTADWGFPARSHAFDTLQAFNPRAEQGQSWSIAAKLHRERIYCATAAFDDRVWVIGGDYIEPDGSRYAVRTVEVYNPRTGRLERGPEPELARPMPLALEARGRLYVMGNARGEYDRPGKMESLGRGETKWRPEPDGPPGMGPLAGAALDGRLFVVVPGKGLAVFDTRSAKWEVLDSPAAPRSCQMAAWRGEIWMMGGRDITNLAETRIYNPRTLSWRLGPELPIPLSWGAAGVVDGRLFITGGAAERAPDDRTWIYNDRTFVLDRP